MTNTATQSTVTRVHVTSEKVPAGAPLPLAAPGESARLSRAITAAPIDLFVPGGLLLILALRIAEVSVKGWEISLILGGVCWLLYLALGLVYYFAFKAASGQMPGKRPLGLRVLNPDGGRPSTSDIARRALLRLVDAFPLMYPLGMIAMLVTGGQRLADLAAKTTVAQPAPAPRRRRVSDGWVVDQTTEPRGRQPGCRRVVVMPASGTVRVLARIVGRELLRHRSHSLLTVAVIAPPVAGGTLLDTVSRESPWARMFGSFLVESFWTEFAVTLITAVLMAGAAVTIAARRQLHTLGLLAAASARGRRLAAIVLLQTAALGLTDLLLVIPAGLLQLQAELSSARGRPLTREAMDHKNADADR
jgi:uncharacterized RDD family membrane protein YckC